MRFSLQMKEHMLRCMKKYLRACSMFKSREQDYVAGFRAGAEFGKHRTYRIIEKKGVRS